MKMYGLEVMIESGLNGEKWTTPDHRVVAVNACICNPNVKTMDDLQSNVKVINSIPADEIRSVTADQLIEAGCYI